MKPYSTQPKEKANSRAAKSEGVKLFVGGLSGDANKELLFNYFGKFGEVLDAFVVHENKKPSGFGFITVADQAVAELILNTRHLIGKSSIDVKPALDRQAAKQKEETDRRKKIFVGGLPKNLPDEELKRYFDQYAVVQKCYVVKDPSTAKTRGFGFVIFTSVEGCSKALAAPGPHVIQGQEVHIKPAVNKDDDYPYPNQIPPQSSPSLHQDAESDAPGPSNAKNRSNTTNNHNNNNKKQKKKVQNPKYNQHQPQPPPPDKKSLVHANAPYHYSDQYHPHHQYQNQYQNQHHYQHLSDNRQYQGYQDYRQDYDYQFGHQDQYQGEYDQAYYDGSGAQDPSHPQPPQYYPYLPGKATPVYDAGAGYDKDNYYGEHSLYHPAPVSNPYDNRSGLVPPDAYYGFGSGSGISWGVPKGIVMPSNVNSTSVNTIPPANSSSPKENTPEEHQKFNMASGVGTTFLSSPPFIQPYGQVVSARDVLQNHDFEQYINSLHFGGIKQIIDINILKHLRFSHQQMLYGQTLGSATDTLEQQNLILGITTNPKGKPIPFSAQVIAPSLPLFGSNQTHEITSSVAYKPQAPAPKSPTPPKRLPSRPSQVEDMYQLNPFIHQEEENSEENLEKADEI